MTIDQAKHLQPGVYFVHWSTGGPGSLAAVGRDANGEPWIAPTNWVRVHQPGAPSNADVWAQVGAVELITTQRGEWLRRGVTEHG